MPWTPNPDAPRLAREDVAEAAAIARHDWATAADVEARLQADTLRDPAGARAHSALCRAVARDFAKRALRLADRPGHAWRAVCEGRLRPEDGV